MLSQCSANSLKTLLCKSNRHNCNDSTWYLAGEEVLAVSVVTHSETVPVLCTGSAKKYSVEPKYQQVTNIGSATRYWQCDKVLAVRQGTVSVTRYWLCHGMCWLACIYFTDDCLASEFVQWQWRSLIRHLSLFFQSTTPAQSPETVTNQRYLLNHLKHSPFNDTCSITWNSHQPTTPAWSPETFTNPWQPDMH